MGHKKNLFEKKRLDSKLTSPYLSAFAARISTVPSIMLGRLPGFIGLVPPPALDKKII
jgi:hypothetical protein